MRFGGLNRTVATKSFEINDPVFSIGNAFGEGIVIRNGNILGAVPEDEAGRWNMLKSSAGVNSGNSGGPLVTRDGKVVSLITQKWDNILYSIPASVILDAGRSELRYWLRTSYSHHILANTANRIFETSVPLPGQYKSIQKRIAQALGDEYEQAMEALFAAAPEYLTGTNNRYLLNESVSSSFPALEMVDKDDDNWYLSHGYGIKYSLPDDGQIARESFYDFDYYAIHPTDFAIYKITRPRSVPLKQINLEPRFIMDTILQNIRRERTLARNDEYRILSYGDPMEMSEYRDALGRFWITATWLIEYADSVLIMYILPLPDGPAVISTLQTSSQRRAYEWDLRKLCDHTQAAYTATFEGWDEFIALNTDLPSFLEDFKFNWKSDTQKISVETGAVSISVDKDVLGWTALSELFIAPCWYRESETVKFGVDRFKLYRDPRHQDYILLYKHIKPDPRLGTVAGENWNDLVLAKNPYDEKPRISLSDTGSVGAILNAESPNPDALYTLYISIKDIQDKENLSSRFNALKGGIRVSK